MKKIPTILFLTLYFFFCVSCNEESNEESILEETTNIQSKINNFNDISYSYNDILFQENILEKAEKLRILKQQPNITQDSLEHFANLLLKQKVNSFSKTADAFITNKLNVQELALYNSNKSLSLLCISDGALATNAAEANYMSSTLYNGNGDAFRHALWNFYMTKDVGSIFAKKWSDAHEYGSVGQAVIEETMDLYNNEVGRQLGIENNNSLRSTFVAKTKEKVRTAKLKIISNNLLFPSDSSGEK